MWEQGRDGRPLCHPMVGTRCPVSPDCTSSQLLVLVLWCGIRLPARGLYLSLLCAMIQDCSRQRAVNVLKSVALNLNFKCAVLQDVLLAAGLGLSVLGWDVDRGLGAVMFLLYHASSVSHGRTICLFLIMLEKPYSCLTFLSVGSCQREVASFSESKPKWRGRVVKFYRA